MQQYNQLSHAARHAIMSNTVSRVAPDDILNRLTAISQSLYRSYMEIGDIANELYAIVRANDMSYTFVQICAFVAEYADRSPAMVMDYAKCAQFYPEEARQEFDGLPFSHFQLARSFIGADEQGTPLWQRVLEMSRDYAAEHGRAPSRARLFVMSNDLRERSIDNYQTGGDGRELPYNNLVASPNPAPALLDDATQNSGYFTAFSEDAITSDSAQKRLDTLYRAMKSLTEQMINLLLETQKFEEIVGKQSPLTTGLARTVAIVRQQLEAHKVLSGELTAGTYITADQIYYKPDA